MKEKTNKMNLWSYFKPHKLAVFMYLLLDIIGSASVVIGSILVANGAALATQQNPNYTTAIIYFAICAATYLLRGICWHCSALIYQKTSKKIMEKMNYDISNQSFKLSSKAYTEHNTGTFVQRMVAEPENIVNKVVNLVDCLTSTLTSIAIILYVVFLNIYIGLIIIVAVIIASFIETKRMKAYRKNQKITREKYDKVHSLSTEIVRSEKDIKSLGLEERLSEVAREKYVDYNQSTYKLAVTNFTYFRIRNTLLQFTGITMLILGVALMEKSLIVPATFMFVYQNYEGLYNVVWNLGNIGDYVSSIKISTERIFALYNDKEFPSEKFGNVSLEKVNGALEFKNVRFSFVDYEDPPDLSKMTKKERKQYKKNPPERKIKSSNQIFDNLSFKIKPNTTVAFVGKSGSGKSTILNLMSKMYEVEDGQVLIDNVNINDLDKKTLRSNISLVNQFPYIFDMTIKENLLLTKKDATDEEIADCIKRASLTDFVASLPEGIDTKVGESGIKLSGGQKQRLAIARALLRNSPIIIFDESTSSLDNFAQEDIKQSIDALKGQGTIIIVAHRLSTIRNADQIFFLDEGKIIDIGTFDELFENNIKFKHMFYAENLK
ncbi:MAG: ABC transporter ATP-binding protein [Clostridiales bacterium]|nr:ABC transporter ATP-binding protein [Clostridiales bacterium]